jgi:hypothetical protein
LPVGTVSPKDMQWKLLDEVEGEIRRRMAPTAQGAVA